MRKLLVSLITVVALGAGVASAQGAYWAGVSAGYPGASLHFGIADIAPDFSVRVNAGFNYIGTGFSLGVDGLYALPVDMGDTPIDVYAGAGVGLGIGGGALGVGLNVFAGGEFNLASAGLPEGGVFLEVGPSIGFVPAFGFGVLGRLGFNYHF